MTVPVSGSTPGPRGKESKAVPDGAGHISGRTDAKPEVTVDVPEFAGEGDFLLRYRGQTWAARHIIDGDVLNVREGTAEPGQLVVVKNADGLAALSVYVPGMEFEGVVVGLMRRLP